MTPAEATAVNVVISHLASLEADPPAEVVRSLHILASRAHNRLQGGWHEKGVREQWPFGFEGV
ncbi:MAG: hypothetical protein M3Y71_05465 [Actinomycetota bacterium]|nr:hypothetical protein [Actinomycetota bacterium]